MNDSKEISWLYELAKRAVWRELQCRPRENETKLCEILIEHCDNLFLDESFFPHIFCSCFSKNGDSLGQWRSYASDGTGVAIGFNRAYLELFVLPQITRLCDVTYRSEDDIKLLTQHLIDAFDRLAKSDLPEHPDQISLTAVETQAEWFTLAPSWKNAAFVEEQEVRLVHAAGPTGGSRPESKIGSVEFYHRRDVLIPYKALPLECDLFPITKIVFGPRNRVEHNRSSVYGLAEKYGFQLAIDQFELSTASYGEIRRTQKLPTPLPKKYS